MPEDYIIDLVHNQIINSDSINKNNKIALLKLLLN